MDNGNGGPGNRVAQDFERSMTEAPKFNPEQLPVPEDKESDPGIRAEEVGNNLNAVNDKIYIDPSMLGASTVQAMQMGEKLDPALGEIVDEGQAGMKSLTEDQIIGTDINALKFQKNGVTKEMERKMDDLQKEKDLSKRFKVFRGLSKEALAASFADRKYLVEDKK